MSERFKSGIKELDTILQGGLPSPAAILVMGPSGSGKTIFSLEASSSNKGKNAVILTNSTPSELQDLVKSMKIKAEFEAVDCYSWLSGERAEVDTLANLSKLLIAIESHVKLGSVVVLDSLTPLGFYNDSDSIKRFLQELVAMAKSSKAMLFVILDKGTYHEDAENVFQSLVDGVIELIPEKGLRVVKMHGTHTSSKLFYYEITDKGFQLHTKGV